MNAKSFFVAALLVAGLAMPAWADPSGTYSVTGTNPDGGDSYDGTVKVTKTGDTFKIVWNIGGDTVTGTAVGNDDILSVGYSSGTKPGVGLYVKDNGKWKGVWSYLGQTSVGEEAWSQ
jgi:hypothetical protein